jgi:dihydrofolate reductase
LRLCHLIESGNSIPWHLPEDLKWFKQVTAGHVLVMGRKTFESVGRPLPDRETIVLSRSAFLHPGVELVSCLDDLQSQAGNRQIFIAGGAQVYTQALPLCSELWLTVVKREVTGDAFFTPFEDQFELLAELRETMSLRRCIIATAHNPDFGDWN